MKKSLTMIALLLLPVLLLSYNGIGLEGYYNIDANMYYIGLDMESGDVLTFGLSIVAPIKYIQELEFQALPLVMLRVNVLNDQNIGVKGGIAPIVWIDQNYKLQYLDSEFFWKAVIYYEGLNIGVVSRYDFKNKTNYGLAFYIALLMVF